MRRYLPSSAVNGAVAACGYTKAMMIKQILTICAAVAAGLAGTSLALAQGYPVAPGPLYSTAPAPYPPGGYPADYRRAPGAPDFDALDEEDDAPNAQSSTALPPPGPVLSPADPRYGRPLGAPPVCSDRGAPPARPPAGPVPSPRRSALWPPSGRSAGLFRPRRADRSNSFA